MTTTMKTKIGKWESETYEQRYLSLSGGGDNNVSHSNNNNIKFKQRMRRDIKIYIYKTIIN